jgi:hypothetical protein
MGAYDTQYWTNHQDSVICTLKVHPVLSLPERGLKMANRTDDSKPGILTKMRIPRTRYQKGRFWGSVLVGLTLVMSLFSNVRSTEFSAEPVAYAVFPVIVLFGTVHTISYLPLKRKISKVFVWIGLGLVAIIAFGMSGFHIYEQALRNGQPWYVAIPYPFVVDFPSVVGMLILAMKDTTQKVIEKAPVVAKATTVAKATKAAVPAKTTPARANGTAKTNLAKTTTAAKSVKPKEIATMFMAPVIDTEVVN